MAKILALDVGKVRTGVAESDPMGMMAFPLETVPTEKLLDFVVVYAQRENPTTLVVGEPKRMHGAASDLEPFILELIGRITTALPTLQVVRVDERFTSKMASRALVEGGMKKSKRKEKGAVDKVAASIILQSYLDQL